MTLKGISFTKVWCGSGVLGFTGEGYWWTKFSRVTATNKNLTFVTKTITLNPHAGNVSLRSNFRPSRFFPETLRINLIESSVINKFGLANPGLKAVLGTGKLQQLEAPFFISIGTISKTQEERIRDFKVLKKILDDTEFQTDFGIQLNYSCPNLSLTEKPNIEEKNQALSIFSEWKRPVVLKISPNDSINDLLMLQQNKALDGFCFSNTVSVAGGGQSGKPLLERNLERIKEMRLRGINKPINGGGGVLSARDAQKYFDAGAESIFFWSATLLSPWRVRKIIRHTYR